MKTKDKIIEVMNEKIGRGDEKIVKLSATVNKWIERLEKSEMTGTRYYNSKAFKSRELPTDRSQHVAEYKATLRSEKFPSFYIITFNDLGAEALVSVPN